MMKMTRISIRLTDALLIVLLVYAMWRYGPLVEKIADAVENDEHLAEIKAILRNGFENITLSHGRSPVCREWAEARHILSEVALSSYYSFTIEEFATDFMNIINSLPDPSEPLLKQAYHYLRMAYSDFNSGDYFSASKNYAKTINTVDYVGDLYGCG